MVVGIEETDTDQETVAVSNRLIDSAIYNLSLAENRLIHTAIASIRKHQKSFSDHIIIDADRYARCAGIPRNSAYDEMADAAERLWQRQLTINEPPQDRRNDVPEDRSEYPLRIRWITELSGLTGKGVYYDKGNGQCGIKFHERLESYLLELDKRGHFTMYALASVTRMHSKYGPRLYEMLAQWRNTKRVYEASIDSIKESWMTGDKRIDNLKRSVIRPAMDDVNQYSDLNVEAKYIKTGPRVTHIRFYFEPKVKPDSKSKKTKPKTASDSQHTDHTGDQDATLDRMKGEFEASGFTFDDEPDVPEKPAPVSGVDTEENKPAPESENESRRSPVAAEGIAALRSASRRRRRSPSVS